MKSHMILLAVTALLSMTRCNQPQPPKQSKPAVPKTMPDLGHQQALVAHGTNASGGSITITINFPIGQLDPENIRKQNKDSLYRYFPLANAESYNHIKVGMRDLVTGEEIILAEK